MPRDLILHIRGVSFSLFKGKNLLVSVFKRRYPELTLHEQKLFHSRRSMYKEVGELVVTMSTCQQGPAEKWLYLQCHFMMWKGQEVEPRAAIFMVRALDPYPLGK